MAWKVGARQGKWAVGLWAPIGRLEGKVCRQLFAVSGNGPALGGAVPPQSSGPRVSHRSAEHRKGMISCGGMISSAEMRLYMWLGLCFPLRCPLHCPTLILNISCSLKENWGFNLQVCVLFLRYLHAECKTTWPLPSNWLCLLRSKGLWNGITICLEGNLVTWGTALTLPAAPSLLYDFSLSAYYSCSEIFLTSIYLSPLPLHWLTSAALFPPSHRGCYNF